MKVKWLNYGIANVQYALNARILKRRQKGIALTAGHPCEVDPKDLPVQYLKDGRDTAGSS